MGFNYAREKRKFDKKWNEKERWYRKSGMSEDAIREMYKYDWSEFNSTRKFYRHGDDNVNVESIVEEDGDSIDKTFSEEWIELLETPNLVRKVRKLSADYIEIIETEALKRGGAGASDPLLAAREKFRERKAYGG